MSLPAHRLPTHRPSRTAGRVQEEIGVTIIEILNKKGRQIIKVRLNDTVLAVVRKLAEHRIGAVVVEDDRMRPVGIFSERDFVDATAKFGSEALTKSAKSLMTAPFISFRPTDDVDDAMAKMTLARIRHLPVMEEDALLGIVSIGDLVKHRLDEKALEAAVLLDLSRMRM
jgi:CBS domain-containing protein